ncbi:hypothetical protein EsVE80_00640 [Enterococcus saigonensis]|uniref:YitT family protein n=1 Tax=Enterococcus saigonensis TaxID=1805431 RepID=A0A679IJ50_9ENTE|nr:membrane protein [Enterococcus saigonensis]BCA84541.1 hypothetical protein EsVE80_00640 [Enterococcus saigonensis]
MNNIVKRLIIVCTGTIIAGFGVQFIVAANMGSDSVSTLILGLLQHTSIPFGRWSQLISLTFLLSTFVYKREILGIGSVINTFLFGEAISFLAQFIQFEANRSFGLNFSYLIVGFTLMALGTAIYLQADLGAGPVEGIMLCLCDKLNFPLKYSRILIDFTIVFVGFLLGGSLGVGTLLAVFALGPMIAGFIYFLEVITEKIMLSLQLTKE